METRTIPGDGVVTGWGTINGRLVYVFARISPSSAARCRNPRAEDLQDHGHGDEERRAGDRPERRGGARIQEGVASLGGYAEVFQRNVLASAWCRRSASSWGRARAARSIPRR
jgi:propionyl-CoA carboxylase beta chain